MSGSEDYCLLPIAYCLLPIADMELNSEPLSDVEKAIIGANQL